MARFRRLSASIEKKPLTIPKAVSLALSPPDQLAVKALEKVGDVQIVEEEEIPAARSFLCTERGVTAGAERSPGKTALS